MATRIADVMSRNGTQVFTEMLTALHQFEKIVIGCKTPFVSESATWSDKFSGLDPLSQISSLDPVNDVLLRPEDDLFPTSEVDRYDDVPSTVEAKDSSEEGEILMSKTTSTKCPWGQQVTKPMWLQQQTVTKNHWMRRRDRKINP